MNPLVSRQYTYHSVSWWTLTQVGFRAGTLGEDLQGHTKGPSACTSDHPKNYVSEGTMTGNHDMYPREKCVWFPSLVEISPQWGTIEPRLRARTLSEGKR